MKVLDLGYEECRKDKEKIKIVCNYTALHFIISGHGYFNGVRLGAGEGFAVIENESVIYEPDRRDPWKYIWIRLADADSLKDENLFARTNTFLWQNSDSIDGAVFVRSLKNRNGFFLTGAVYRMLSYIVPREAEISVQKQHVLDAKEYIRTRYALISSVDEVARHLGLSRAYLRNIFILFEGIPPRDYLIKTRFERACRLLENNVSVKVTAYSVGYDDQMQFTRLFKKHFGVSPTEYKKNALDFSSGIHISN